MYKVGQKVRIDYIADEMLSYFNGLEGTITKIYSFGQRMVQIMVNGPWGGIAIIPDEDKITVID